MQLTIPKRSHRAILIVGYVAWPYIGWLAADLIGGVVGFVFAYGFDRFYPRCMTDLCWADFQRAITRFQDVGFLGSRIHIHIGGKSLYVYRGEVRGHPALSLQYNRSEWAGIIDESLERVFLKKWCDTIMPPKRWKLRYYVTMVVAPERESPPQSILAMLRECFQRAGFEPAQAFARVDFARVPIRTLFDESDRIGGIH